MKQLRNAAEDKAAKAKADTDDSIRVCPLKYASASQVTKTLQAMYPDCQFSEDLRQNAIVINAGKDGHAKILELIKSIDVPGKEEDATSIVRANPKDVEASGTIVSRFAGMLGVDFAFDQETGVFMIKGPKNDVQRVTKIIDEISAITREKIASDAKASTRSYALRVLWLSNELVPSGSEPTMTDAKLESSIQKLSALGFSNMKVRMQLLGRCDLIDGQGHCKVDGSNLESDPRRTFDLKATFSGESERVSGKLTILAGVYSANTENPPTASKVEVALNLRPEKYYIVSAGPIGGIQSAFVVQLIEDL